MRSLAVMMVLATTLTLSGAEPQPPDSAPPASEEIEELEEFVPSEEVSLDKTVSFPVDI